MVQGRAVPPQSSVLRQFGRAVRELRGELGISQEELGFRSDMDRTHVGNIERGASNLSLRAVMKLARGLGVRPSELIERFEERLRDVPHDPPSHSGTSGTS
jgi:transcriptional regulator with XRE-family HTH domain